MNIKAYMLGQKHKLFPEFLKMDQLEEYEFAKERENSNVHDLSYRDWFWFHPSTYKMFTYGIPILCIFSFGSSSIFCYFKGWFFAGILSLIFMLSGIYSLYKTLQNPNHASTTFYKMWFE